MFGPPTNLLARRRGYLAAGCVGLAAVIVLVLIGGSGAAAKAGAPPPTTYASYPTLSSTESSGLPVAAIGSPSAAALATKGPVFPATPSSGMASHGPVPSSIRKLTVSAPDASAWIAKSAEGGICVLASRHQPAAKGSYGLGISCVPAELMSSGTMLELQDTQGGTNIVVGAVPDDVSAVEVTLSNGDSQTVPASGNAWSLETSAQVQSTQTVIGG